MKREMRQTPQNAIVSQLFFRLLPIQALIVAMGSVKSIVDGVIAGRFIAPSASEHRLPSPSREWKLRGWDEKRAWV